GNAAARLAGLNSIYAFGSSAGIPFFIACDSSPPVKPESFAILKFENNPNDGFNGLVYGAYPEGYVPYALLCLVFCFFITVLY
ncbi:hypothetical protein, partial [Pontibacter lucknowensis]